MQKEITRLASLKQFLTERHDELEAKLKKMKEEIHERERTIREMTEEKSILSS